MWIHSYSTTKKMHFSQIIYSCKMLYMFRTVFPSIRSSKLHIGKRHVSDSCWYLLLTGSSNCLKHVCCCTLSSWVPFRPRQQQVAAALWNMPVAVCAVLSS